MKKYIPTTLFTAIACTLLLSACAPHDVYSAKGSGFSRGGNYANYEPTLVQIARIRAAKDPDHKDDAFIENYHVTDRDVLDYTDHVKTLLTARLHNATGLREGSSALQILLSSLTTIGSSLNWATASVTALSTATTGISGLSSSYNAKDHAKAYQQTLDMIISAEGQYYAGVTGVKFKTDETSKKTYADIENAKGEASVPSHEKLTGWGESLYYRTNKALAVLNSTLTGQIPDLQSLKDATGKN